MTLYQLGALGGISLILIMLGWLIITMRGRVTSASPPSSEEHELAALKGQLSQLTTLASSQQLAQSEQMASLSKRLDESLATMNERLGRSLHQHSEKTHENLTRLSERLAVIDAANSQISALTSQVTQLHNILANKTDRGAFGEVQLENLVRNVLPPDAYEFQVQLSNNRRADCVLKLPNPPGNIIIDAKFPLEAWHKLQAAEDEAARINARKQLTADILKHVKDIHERYIITGETADSACLFLPSEAVYAELHAHLRDVVEHSYKARVWIVSPTTMMATLNTVRAILRDARMREQTALIQKEIGMLSDDVIRLGKRVDNLDKHFSLASRDISEIKTSTGKITSRGRRIQDYDVEDTTTETAIGDTSDMLTAPLPPSQTSPQTE